MSAPSRLRNPNPHLGAYYGIVTSAFVSLVIMLAMFEQLGWRQPVLAETMIVGPLALYLLIAIGSPPGRPASSARHGRAPTRAARALRAGLGSLRHR